MRELTRVATSETEQEWLAAAQGKAVREVEKMVSGHQPGGRPGAATDPRARRHVIRFEISGETLATLREAMGKLRRDSVEALDDDAAILLMARHVLQGPVDEGRANYQVAFNVCESCRRAEQLGRGQTVAVGAEVVAMAECDAQRIGGSASSDDTHVGASGRHAPRATQSVPPATRRAVLRRDGGCCVFPGCRQATFVDVHHVQPRAAGGSHDADNLITVCAAHHRSVHRGYVVVEGRVSTGLSFRHADGRNYGSVVSPAPIAARAKAFQALRAMGFGEAEVRRALGRIAADAATSASIEHIVRKCLAVLTSRIVAQAS